MKKDLEDVSQHIHHLHTLSTPHRPESANSNQLSETEAEKALKLMEDTCQFWIRWIMAYLERTKIRINLVTLVNSQIRLSHHFNAFSRCTTLLLRETTGSTRTSAT